MKALLSGMIPLAGMVGAAGRVGGDARVVENLPMALLAVMSSFARTGRLWVRTLPKIVPK